MCHVKRFKRLLKFMRLRHPINQVKDVNNSSVYF